METKFKVNEIEGKLDKKGTQYWIVDTDQGIMSCWDENMVKECNEAMNSDSFVTLNVEINGDYKNIRKPKVNGIKSPLTKVSYEGTKLPMAKETIHVSSGSMTTGNGKINGRYDPTSMYVSYAKDIFNELLLTTEDRMEKESTKIMTRAIELVKQAQEGFK